MRTCIQMNPLVRAISEYCAESIISESWRIRMVLGRILTGTLIKRKWDILHNLEFSITLVHKEEWTLEMMISLKSLMFIKLFVMLLTMKQSEVIMFDSRRWYLWQWFYFVIKIECKRFQVFLLHVLNDEKKSYVILN